MNNFQEAQCENMHDHIISSLQGCTNLTLESDIDPVLTQSAGSVSACRLMDTSVSVQCCLVFTSACNSS